MNHVGRQTGFKFIKITTVLTMSIYGLEKRWQKISKDGSKLIVAEKSNKSCQNKKNRRKKKHHRMKHNIQTQDREIQSPTKIEGDLVCSGRVGLTLSATSNTVI